MASRRKLLQGVVALGAAWAVMARPWNWGRRPVLDFTEIADLAPFRRLAGGDVSLGGAAGAVLIGLDSPDPTNAVLAARLRAGLTDLMWGDWAGGVPVPVSYFTDIRCPVCRVLDARLPALEGITLTTREFPVFGEGSELSARAILSAARQAQGEALRARLKRAPVQLTRAYVETAIGGLSLDRDRFLADLDGPEVAARLAEDRALGRLFELPGTPGLVIGRSVIVGLQTSAVLAAIVDDEARLGPVANG